MNGRWKFTALLLALGCAAYLGSLGAPFLLDDWQNIVGRDHIERLWPVGGMPNRKVLTFSLALNYAVAGYEPWAFRLTNIAIHITAALLLFGVVRRTLTAPGFTARFDPRLAESADGLGFAIAVLWMLHPIHTQAVTYIWQRSESLMGMFFLAAIYCLTRLAHGGRKWLWTSIALAMCFLGFGSKEVMAAVIPVALIYDGGLLRGSYRAALRENRVLHGVLFLTALMVLFVVVPRTPTSLGKIDWLSYALSQPAIVLEYAWLTIWPHPLCFDYSRAPAVGFLAIAPATAVVGALLAATAYGVWRRTWWGVLGAWYFLILAPTSSVVAINDLMVEYRLYLPMLALIAPAVIGAFRLCRSVDASPVIPLGLAALLLGTLTVRRNSTFETRESIWSSVLEIVPDNPRAHDYLSQLAIKAGQFDKAEQHARRVIEIAPTHSAHGNLAVTLQRRGDLLGAIEQLRAAKQLRPHVALPYYELGKILCELERFDEAVPELEAGLEINGASAYAHRLLVDALRETGEIARAIEVCRRAFTLDAVKQNPQLRHQFQNRLRVLRKRL